MNSFDRDPWTTEIGTALLATSADPDMIDMAPDGTWCAYLTNGATFHFGEDGADETGQRWWTGTLTTSDGSEMTNSWPSVDELAKKVGWLTGIVVIEGQAYDLNKEVPLH